MATRYFHLNKTEKTLIKDWKNRGISLRETGHRLNRSHNQGQRICFISSKLVVLLTGD